MDLRRYLFFSFILCLVLVESNSNNQTNWLKHFAKAKQSNLIDAVTEPLYNLMPYERISYTETNISAEFKSSTKFDTLGMSHLYMITEEFMRFIRNADALPDGFIEMGKDGDTVRILDIKKEWIPVVKHYSLILLTVILAVLFIVAMPSIGLFLCCCRCYGKCSTRSQLYDKRYDSCRRIFYGILLSTITILISFGFVCSLTTNELVESGVNTLPDNIRATLHDTDLYLNNTKTEVNNLLVVNYKELEQTLYTILDSSGQIILTKLGRVSKANVLLNLTTIVTGLSAVKSDLTKLDNITKLLYTNTHQLDQGLKEIRETLMKKLKMCITEPACIEFTRKYDLSLSISSLEYDYSELPNVTTALQNLSELVAADINKEVETGKRQFELAQGSIQIAIEKYIAPVKEEIQNIGKSLNNVAGRITNGINKIQLEIGNSYEPLNKGEGFIQDFSPYRYYVGVGVSCLLLIILACLTFGLICGFCGSRPNNGYQEDCNKGVGSRYLMLAVFVMFLTSSVLMSIALIYFIMGITTDTVICQTLYKTDKNGLMPILDKMIDLNKVYQKYGGFKVDEQILLSDIIKNCHQNRSLYEVLELEKFVNIMELENYPKTFNIENRVNEIVRNIRLDQKISIITPEAQELLKELAQSSLNDIDLSPYMRVVDETISKDMAHIADAINHTATKLPPRLNTLKLDLLNQVLYYKTYQNLLIPTLIELSQEMKSLALRIQQHLKFNHVSLKTAIEHVLSDVQEAQVFFNQDGRTVITKLANDFGAEFIGHLEDYLHRVVSRTKNYIGKCGPISEAYNGTLVAVCNRVLSPFNGFWMSVGSVLLLFVPAIVLCLWLSELYQKSDGYLGPLVEMPWDQQTDTAVAKPATEYRNPSTTSPAINAATTPTGSSPYRNPEYERPPPYYYPKRASVLQTEE